MGKSDEEDKPKNYLVSAFISLILISIVSTFWGSSLAPFTMFSQWESDGGIFYWLWLGWPMLLWGSAVTFLICAFHSDQIRRSRESAEAYLFVGFLRSVWAGIMEEICFRWLIFLNSLWMAKVVSFLLCGFPQWLHLHLVGPIANFFTFGLMESLIYHPSSWAVGAAILSTNAFFRDGHKYLGVFGFINSWFIGMFLFWVALTHGLIAAIFLHFLYDLLIHFVVYLFLRK